MASCARIGEPGFFPSTAAAAPTSAADRRQRRPVRPATPGAPASQCVAWIAHRRDGRAQPPDERDARGPMLTDEDTERDGE
jgi:hypothetical protein